MESSTGWRRRLLGLPIAVWVIVLVFALAAVAAWLSRENTAPNTATATAIGLVNIGTLETDPWFLPASISALSPGSTVERCTVVAVDATAATGPGNFRVYLNGAAGGSGLAEHLTLQISARAVAGGTPGGGISCSGTWPAPIFGGVMSGLATTFVGGGVIGAPAAGDIRTFEMKAALTLPDTVAVQEGASGETATFSFAFENQ
jgi:hypothetical protein